MAYSNTWNTSLRESIQSAADYNRSFGETGLYTLDQKKHAGASAADLHAAINSMVEEQKKVVWKYKLSKKILYLKSGCGLSCNY